MLDPTDENLARFEERFRDKQSMMNARNGPPLLEQRFMLDIAALRNNFLASNSTISRDLARLEDRHLQEIALHLSRFGLSSWCPNHAESPYSLYNQAHRTIAVDTFKYSATNCAYIALEPDLSFLDNTNLLYRIYDNCVHERHFKRRGMERNNPGSVAASIEATNMYKRRSEV